MSEKRVEGILLGMEGFLGFETGRDGRIVGILRSFSTLILSFTSVVSLISFLSFTIFYLDVITL